MIFDPEFLQFVKDVGFPIGIALILLYDRVFMEARRQERQAELMSGIGIKLATIETKIDNLKNEHGG